MYMVVGCNTLSNRRTNSFMIWNGMNAIRVFFTIKLNSLEGGPAWGYVALNLLLLSSMLSIRIRITRHTANLV